MAWNPIKSQSTRACQKAGTWPEARLWRIGEKKRLKKEEHLTADEANELSWELMARKFCPEVAEKYCGEGSPTKGGPRMEKDRAIAAVVKRELEASVVEEESPEDVPAKPVKSSRMSQAARDRQAEEFFAALDADAPPPDLIRDTLWVYQALSVRNVQRKDSPSPGAWGLFLWAKEAKNRFFEQFLPKAMSARRVDEDDRENVRENRKQMEEIRKVLGQLLEARRDGDE